MVDGDTGSDRMLDAMLRTGPHGDAFGENPDGLSLQKLRDTRTASISARSNRGCRCAPDPGEADRSLRRPVPQGAHRLEARVEWAGDGRLRLIGRRHLWSNNSWMHNVEVLVKGKARCTLQINPDDAAELGVVDGGKASVRPGRRVTADVEVTDIVMPGVVSLPQLGSRPAGSPTRCRRPSCRCELECAHRSAGDRSGVGHERARTASRSSCSPEHQRPAEVLEGRPRASHAGAVYAAELSEALRASIPELRNFMDWAQDDPSADEAIGEFLAICDRDWIADRAYNSTSSSLTRMRSSATAP